MKNVLADLALESEVAAVLTFRLARAYDESDEAPLVFRRVVTPAAKFWICKLAPDVTLEAMEVLGGSGYIEESIMPRLYREAPVNSIWKAPAMSCAWTCCAPSSERRTRRRCCAQLDDGGNTRLRASPKACSSGSIVCP